jgi:UDP-N-acetylbacillosamine N-acetyltransferase
MMKTDNTIIIMGGGGHARSVADVLLYNNPKQNIWFVDPCAKLEEKTFDFSVLKEFPTNMIDYKLIIGVGNNEARKEIYEKSLLNQIISVISAKANICRNVQIGLGSFLAHNCHIGPETVIGRNAIINTMAIVEHEVKIGDHSHIAPGTIVSGRSQIGNQVFIGAGSTVIDKISICSNTIIGAGSVVVENIDISGTYVGVPVRKVK